ncbi:MAG: PIN domain-containing protein [Verrucomicrobia bacterium]|nr:PIN domain-containing protein [Verrucomicrobiota bacterium]
MNYLDANFATALHFNVQGQTVLAEKFVRRNSRPYVLSELAELECHRAFVIRTGRSDSENWNRLQEFISSGTWKREHLLWNSLSEKARQLIDRYGSKLKAGTLDTMHTAQALLSGCTWFLSFDPHSNARVLAATCRLKVFPELSALEKGRVVR